VLIPIRRMNHTALETRGRVADALRGLAAALTDLFALRRPPDAPLWESFDDMAWGLADIAETLTRLERAFNETPRYRSLGASARKAARERSRHWKRRGLRSSSLRSGGAITPGGDRGGAPFHAQRP